MRKSTALIAIAAAFSVTACGNMAQNRSLNSVHQPVVTRTNYALDLNTFGGALTTNEMQRLADWFDAMDLGYGDRVAIDNPSGNDAAMTAMVEAVASRHGVAVSDYAPITAGGIRPGTVRVVVTRSTASVPGCPDWASSSETNFNNGTSSNFGCAMNGNLAAMVANPEDLVRGQPGSDTVDASGSNKAIKTYREAEPTGTQGLKQNSTQSSGGGQ